MRYVLYHIQFESPGAFEEQRKPTLVILFLSEVLEIEQTSLGPLLKKNPWQNAGERSSV